MCRLVGAISNGPLDAVDLLAEAPQSLLRQSRIDKKRPQGDGWGVGWFEKGGPRLIKSPGALYREAGALRAAARRVKGKALIGHVRWASNPLKLPRHNLIGLVHTQPFRHRGWIFAHNGTLLIPKEVRAELGSLGKQVQGNNDSEVLFYWLMKHVKPGTAGQIATDIRRGLRGLDSIWKKCRKRYPLYKHPYHGLNWVLTNGNILIAMCYVNPDGFGKARALIKRAEPYYQLRYRHDPDGWVVASEPLDRRPGWKTFRHGQVLVTNGTKGRFVQCF